MTTPGTPPQKRARWLARLRQGLQKSALNLAKTLRQLVTGKAFDAGAALSLEDALIGADIGPALAAELVANLQTALKTRDFTPADLPNLLCADIAGKLKPYARALDIDATRKPFVILVIGVNGSGKTTTIAKLTRHLQERGLSVMLGAADTFRAAAIEQLCHWGERLGARVIFGKAGQDPASVAYEALAKAREAHAQNACDVLIIDTAGRLHNKGALMAELGKIIRSLKKQDEAAPHATLLVLDATVGQNALMQVEAFAKIAPVTGLVMTKLDGTARGGILLNVCQKFKLPVHFIGVGESAEDLDGFLAEDFARGLLGLDGD